MNEKTKRAVGAIIVLIMLFSVAGTALFYTGSQQPQQPEKPSVEIQQITERALTNDERLLILRSGGVILEYTYKDLNYTRKTEIEDFILKSTEGKAILSEYKAEEDRIEMIGIDQTNPRAAEVRKLGNANPTELFSNFCDLVLAEPRPLSCTLKGLNIGGASPTANQSEPTEPTNGTVQNSTINQTPSQNTTQNSTQPSTNGTKQNETK